MRFYIFIFLIAASFQVHAQIYAKGFLTINPPEVVQNLEYWKAKAIRYLQTSPLVCPNLKPVDWIDDVQFANLVKLDLKATEKTNWLAQAILPGHPAQVSKNPTVTFAQVVDIRRPLEDSVNSLYVLQFTLSADLRSVLALDIFGGSSGLPVNGKMNHDLARVESCILPRQ